MTYTIVVLDQFQAPVPQAEVNVALIDKAVLSLAPEAQRSMVDVFYYQRPLDVKTGAS